MGSRRIQLISTCLGIGLLVSVALVSAQDATTHTVQAGDNLYRIAQQYNVTVNELAEANELEFTWRIVPGQVLVIPTDTLETFAEEPVEVAAADIPSSAQTHIVSWGESLGTIARRYGLTLDQLAQLNDITNPDLIYVGQELIVSSAPIPELEMNVEAGSSAATAPESITESAAPAPEPLMPSYSVIIPPEAESSTATTNITTDATTHIVSYGESLSGIARNYGVSMLAITQANNIYNADTIYVGQELIIPSANISVPDAGVSTVAAAPSPNLTIGREIIVDLSEQRIYAYENGVLVRNVLVSTGLPATPTVRGEFTAQRKYVAQTMTGPGYYLPDVPYVVYFYAGYALHGTYWLDSFGQTMSHGCVNLPTPEAEWFYNFADIGTPINVQV